MIAGMMRAVAMPDQTNQLLQNRPTRRFWIRDAAVGLVIVGIGVAAQAALKWPLNGHVGFECTLLAIVIVAWTCRLQTALVCILFATLAQTWFLLEPRWSLSIANTGEAIQFALFIAVSLVITLLADRLKRSRVANVAALRELVKSDQARQSSESQLDAGLNAISDPVLMLAAVRDAAGVIVDFEVEFANRAAIPGGNTSGRRLSEAAPQHAALGLVAKYASVLESGTPLEVTATMPAHSCDRPDDARPCFVEVRADRRGVDGVVVRWRDVSERRLAEQAIRLSEQRFRRLYDSNLAGIVFYRPDGTLSDPNDAFLQLLGYSRGRIETDLNWRDLVLPAWAAQEEAAQKTLEAEGRCGPFEAELLGADGKPVPVLITGAELYDSDSEDGRGSGVRSIVDLTRIKQVEEALRRTEASLRMANESLEHRIQERTLELQHRSDQLRALALDLTETESRERKRLAQMLHDHFQQLVSAAKLKVGIVRRKLTDESLIEMVKQVESLLEETINASRNLATELSPPVLHDAGLGAALEWLGRRMERDQNLEVTLRVDENTEPDNEQVRTIVFECARELLFNVVKHAKSKQATLTLSMAAEGLLQLAVSDSGSGFDAHAIEMKAKPDGSFGLFSIKERLGLLGGLVKVRSQPGQGTTVTLTVPVTVKQEPSSVATGQLFETAAAEIPTSRVPDVRVLVADDHKLFREGLIALLSQESFVHIIGQANDGEEAVALARELKPDILIIDVTMPKLNGVQVTAQVMKDLPATKIIGLSMHERDDMANAMREAGAAAYCSKGGPTEALLNVLRGVALTPPRS